MTKTRWWIVAALSAAVATGSLLWLWSSGSLRCLECDCTFAVDAVNARCRLPAYLSYSVLVFLVVTVVATTITVVAAVRGKSNSSSSTTGSTEPPNQTSRRIIRLRWIVVLCSLVGVIDFGLCTRQFIAVDACLDHGGVFDYSTEECLTGPTAPRGRAPTDDLAGGRLPSG